jgi:hypothetical protein
VAALDGFQLFAVMVSVSGTLPVFFMYIVCVAVPPGLRTPEFKAVTGCVQALSEYIPKFTAVIEPLRGTVWLELRSAAVVAVRAIAVIMSAIIPVFGMFWNFIVISLDVISLKY